uniref:Uncharacterized protein n=1 Tax=Anguilla anguilla TaxID=7936 RepID=A0A0E9Q1C9_ANGAN
MGAIWHGCNHPVSCFVFWNFPYGNKSRQFVLCAISHALYRSW